MIVEGLIDLGHAKVILSLEDKVLLVSINFSDFSINISFIITSNLEKYNLNFKKNINESLKYVFTWLKNKKYNNSLHNYNFRHNKVYFKLINI